MVKKIERGRAYIINSIILLTIVIIQIITKKFLLQYTLTSLEKYQYYKTHHILT